MVVTNNSSHASSIAIPPGGLRFQTMSEGQWRDWIVAQNHRNQSSTVSNNSTARPLEILIYNLGRALTECTIGSDSPPGEFTEWGRMNTVESDQKDFHLKVMPVIRTNQQLKHQLIGRFGIQDQLIPHRSPEDKYYKTELCRHYLRNAEGYCSYGSKCQFAHGFGELRLTLHNRRYKTVLCHRFYRLGVCSYGRRCDFIHAETPEKLMAVRLQNELLQAYAETHRMDGDIRFVDLFHVDPKILERTRLYNMISDNFTE